MAVPFIVREAREEDIEKIYEIEKISFPYPYSPWDFRYYLEVESEYFFVAESEGEVIGYIVATLWRDLITIVSLAVTPKRRQEGVATALLESVEEECRDKAQRIELQVRVSNRPAIALYEKMGFEKADLIPRYYRDGEDAYLFYKRLNMGGN
ncbi:MAG: ribosomal protein S18-alanine N-acetyltransferase [Caldiserica bacterium]|nr:ribosomal protein S18-alanine N-acetyltransferase [Caldisericota bacterium]